MTKHARTTAALVSAVAIMGLAVTAEAGAVRTAQFNGSTLPGNDDGSSGLEAIGFAVNYFGTTYSSLYVNNNGNVTFDAPLSTFTPFDLLSTATPIIAPFFGDVVTWDAAVNGPAIPDVSYGTGSVGGRAAFGVNWIDVGYYFDGIDKLNSFQLVMIDRSDVGAGDFDFEFNFDKIQWETGDASGGSGGLGGSSARSGWSNGVASSFEIAGSAVNGAFLDSNVVSGLIHNRLNSTVDGRYVFNVRNGEVSAVPVPQSALLGLPMLAGLGLIAAIGRRRQPTV